jgi:opacity protein-like surface antigen
MNASSRLAITLVISAGMPFAAQAANSSWASAPENRTGWFAGGGIGSLSLDQTGVPSQDMGYVFVQGGWRFNRYLAVGARAGSSSSAALDLNNVDIDFGVDPGYLDIDFRVTAVYGVFAQAYLPLAENWDLYALLGYSHTRIEASADGVFSEVSVSDSADSLSYGVGVSWILNPRFTIDLEYQPVVADGSDWSASSANLAFRFRF